MLALKGLVGLHRTGQLFSFFSWGIDLDYHDIVWFALETNQDHSVVFEIEPKYCISDSFLDYVGYSISYKRFFPTVNIMVCELQMHGEHCYMYQQS